MIQLPSVTALIVDGRTFDSAMEQQCHAVCRHLLDNFSFGGGVKAGLLKDPSIAGVSYFKVEPMNIDGYSKWCLESMHSHVDTDFVMVFQLDGFVVNPQLWDAEFLNYDYIGAPWVSFYAGKQVGNGGFSLRSKKLLKLCADYGYRGGNEDGAICVYGREFFEAGGARFAPLEVARRFSVERPLDDAHVVGSCFGQHSRVFDPSERVP